MLVNRFRKYKCISDFWDDKSGQLCSVKRVINLCDVANYEEWADMDHPDGIPRTVIFFNNNAMPLTARVPFDVFDAVYEKFLSDMGLLDDRSVKKKHTYNGPMKFLFDLTHNYTVIHAYPQGYDFNNRTMEEVRDANLLTNVTIMN